MISWRRPLTLLALAALFALACFPLLWTVLNSFKQLTDIVTPVPKLLFTPTLDNYAYVFSRPSIREALLNSATVTGATVAIAALLGIPAAYAIARHPGRNGDGVRFFVLSLRFLPPVAIALPLIMLWIELDLYDSRTALVATYLLVALSTVVWLAIPAFERVPKEIEEAARIDGYGPFSVFARVALPVAWPGLFGALVFSFVLIWNEFFIALVLTTSEAKTLPVVASEFTLLGRNVPWGILNASVVVLSIPPLLFLGVLSRFVSQQLASAKRPPTGGAS